MAIGSPHGFVLIGLYFGASRVVEACLEGGIEEPGGSDGDPGSVDLTGTLRGAAELAGCDHQTVAHWVRAREEAGCGLPVAVRRRPRVDTFAVKIEEWVDRSRRRIRPDVAHQRLVATGYRGSERTTRRAVATAKRAWRAEHGRRTRPWVTEPGLWMPWDGDGPTVAGQATVLFCAWLAWSRFRVIVPLWDRTMPSVVMALDRALRRFGGAPTYALTDNERLRRSPTMRDPRMVAVGLDVHKSSVRLAAMCGGEVLRDVTLTFDHAAVLRELRAWARRAVCQEAGPTGFGLHRPLVAPASTARSWRRGWCPRGRAIASRPTSATPVDWRRCMPPGCRRRSPCPRRILGRCADLVRAREDARVDRCRARHPLGRFVLRRDRRMPKTCWGVTHRAWLGRQTFALPGQPAGLRDYLFAVDQLERRIGVLEAEIGGWQPTAHTPG